MTELLGRGRHFSAVACYNDSMAAGAMGVLNDNGIDVPREISLIGFDDVLISRYVRPRLTTVRYPIVTMATRGGRAGFSPGGAAAGAGDHPSVQPDAGPSSLGGRPAGKAISHSDRGARRWPGNPAPRRCSASRSVHRNPGRRSRDRAPESPRGGHNRSHAAAVFRPAPDRGRRARRTAPPAGETDPRRLIKSQRQRPIVPSNCSPSTAIKVNGSASAVWLCCTMLAKNCRGSVSPPKACHSQSVTCGAYCGAAYSGRIVIPASPEKSALSRTDSRQSRGVLIGQLQQAVFDVFQMLPHRLPGRPSHRDAAARRAGSAGRRAISAAGRGWQYAH